MKISFSRQGKSGGFVRGPYRRSWSPCLEFLNWDTSPLCVQAPLHRPHGTWGTRGADQCEHDTQVFHSTNNERSTLSGLSVRFPASFPAGSRPPYQLQDIPALGLLEGLPKKPGEERPLREYLWKEKGTLVGARCVRERKAGTISAWKLLKIKYWHDMGRICRAGDG